MTARRNSVGQRHPRRRTTTPRRRTTTPTRRTPRRRTTPMRRTTTPTKRTMPMRRTTTPRKRTPTRRRMTPRRRTTRRTPGRRTTDAAEEEVGDEEEKRCHCLQSFALWCGQFRVPSPHQFLFFLWWGLGT